MHQLQVLVSGRAFTVWWIVSGYIDLIRKSPSLQAVLEPRHSTCLIIRSFFTLHTCWIEIQLVRMCTNHFENRHHAPKEYMHRIRVDNNYHSTALFESTLELGVG